MSQETETATKLSEEGERRWLEIRAIEGEKYAAHLRASFEQMVKATDRETVIRTNHYNIANRVNRASLILSLVTCACFGVLAVVLVTKLL